MKEQLSLVTLKINNIPTAASLILLSGETPEETVSRYSTPKILRTFTEVEKSAPKQIRTEAEGTINKNALNVIVKSNEGFGLEPSLTMRLIIDVNDKPNAIRDLSNAETLLQSEYRSLLGKANDELIEAITNALSIKKQLSFSSKTIGFASDEENSITLLSDTQQFSDSL